MSDRPRRVALVVLLCVLDGTGCTRLPTGPVERFDPPVRGVILADWTADGYASPAGIAALDAIAATGANSVTLVVTAYQVDARGVSVRASDPRTPTMAAVRQVAAAAAARGMAVTLKPHVDPDDGTWRGRIAPTDRAAWFVSYRAFVLPWARLADSLGAARFAVGTELAGTIDAVDEWRATVAAVRAVFHGVVVYAASWDEAQRIPFWESLDFVGVDFYFPVARRANAGRLELLAGWAPWLDRLQRLHEQSGKRILLTEVGYRSVDGAGMHPYALASGASIDLGEQADLYWAALEAVGNTSWMEGMDWWNWTADGSGGPADPGFTPSGKPAADELRGAWSR